MNQYRSRRWHGRDFSAVAAGRGAASAPRPAASVPSRWAGARPCRTCTSTGGTVRFLSARRSPGLTSRIWRLGQAPRMPHRPVLSRRLAFSWRTPASISPSSRRMIFPGVTRFVTHPCAASIASTTASKRSLRSCRRPVYVRRDAVADDRMALDRTVGTEGTGEDCHAGSCGEVCQSWSTSASLQAGVMCYLAGLATGQVWTGSPVSAQWR